MLAGAQKIINVRPLIPARANPDDCDSVTPSSLIHHHSVKPINPIGALPTRESLLRNHRHVQDRVDVFWQKWVQLYLQCLQKRHTQRMIQKNFEISDLILLSDHPTARGQYPLACVLEVFPNQKYIVWCVHIMTADSNRLNVNLPCTCTLLERDTTKISLLEFRAINPIFNRFNMTVMNNDDQTVPDSDPLITEPSVTNTYLHLHHNPHMNSTLTQTLSHTLSPELCCSGPISC